MAEGHTSLCSLTLLTVQQKMHVDLEIISKDLLFLYMCKNPEKKASLTKTLWR